MTAYNGLQSVLNLALEEYHSMGFRLVESGDDELVLFYKDEFVARFWQIRATFRGIKEQCQMYLEEHE